MTGSQIVPVEEDLGNVATLGKALLDSGYFKDVRTVAEAGVKILAGRELGLGPVESMRAFYVIDGKIDYTAEFLAQRVRLHPRYSYRVVKLDNFECTLEFSEDGTAIGVSRFDSEDRELAGFRLETDKGNATPWAKFPRNLMFARAMSNGVAWFCPDVVSGNDRSSVESVLSTELAAAPEVLPSVPLSSEPVAVAALEDAAAERPESAAYGEGVADSGDNSGVEGDGQLVGDATADPSIPEPPESPSSVHDHIWADSETLAKHEICTVEGCLEVRRKAKPSVHTEPPQERKDIAS